MFAWRQVVGFAAVSEFPSTSAEAAAQAAGYYFQIRFGLYRALKRLLRDPTGSIAIERIDDRAKIGARHLA